MIRQPSPLVITVTLNPAIDLTVTVDHLTVGSVQRARSAAAMVGGKGVNVAGCLADWGVRVAATGILGRSNDGAFAEFFLAKGIIDHFIRAPGETRTNVKIADLATGETTDINLPGLLAPASTVEAVHKATLAAAAPGKPVVLAGSLPAGLPDDTWVGLAAALIRLGAEVVLDSSGPPLAQVLAAGLPLRAIKPNRGELEAAVGRPLPTTADVVAAARDLTTRGIGLVVVSLGEEGALFIDAGHALHAALPPRAVLSTVGAGDAMVAGLVAGLIEQAGPERLARLAVAFSASKLDRLGPHLGTADSVERLAAAATVTALSS